MHKLPQTANIADLRNNHLSVLAMLEKGPVVINSRSQPVAVVISPQQWDAAADELARLRRMVKIDRALAEVTAGAVVSHEELVKQLAA